MQLRTCYDLRTYLSLMNLLNEAYSRCALKAAEAQYVCLRLLPYGHDEAARLAIRWGRFKFGVEIAPEQFDQQKARVAIEDDRRRAEAVRQEFKAVPFYFDLACPQRD